jgi:HPt (histidine-containing phosphotransfer) domain-containing protein/PAS domain-containing protein
MKSPFFKQMWKTLLDKKIWSGVIKNRSKKGKDYFVQSTIAPILNDNDEIVEFIALREDVTEIILNKNQLKEEKDRIAMLFDAIDEIVIIKKDNVIDQINKKFFEILPFRDIHDFKQFHNSISELFIPYDGYLQNSLESNDWLEKVLNDTSIDNKAMMKDRDGQIRTFRVKAKKVPTAKSYYYLITLNDISLLSPLPLDCIGAKQDTPNRYEQVLAESEKSLGLSPMIIERLLEAFITSTTKGIEELFEASSLQNHSTLERVAHNIKGSASTLHLNEIATIAQQIELDAKNQIFSNLKTNLSQLSSLFDELKRSIQC